MKISEIKTRFKHEWEFYLDTAFLTMLLYLTYGGHDEMIYALGALTVLNAVQIYFKDHLLKDSALAYKEELNWTLNRNFLLAINAIWVFPLAASSPPFASYMLAAFYLALLLLKIDVINRYITNAQMQESHDHKAG